MFQLCKKDCSSMSILYLQLHGNTGTLDDLPAKSMEFLVFSSLFPTIAIATNHHLSFIYTALLHGHCMRQICSFSFSASAFFLTHTPLVFVICFNHFQCSSFRLFKTVQIRVLPFHLQFFIFTANFFLYSFSPF